MSKMIAGLPKIPNHVKEGDEITVALPNGFFPNGEPRPLIVETVKIVKIPSARQNAWADSPSFGRCIVNPCSFNIND